MDYSGGSPFWNRASQLTVVNGPETYSSRLAGEDSLGNGSRWVCRRSRMIWWEKVIWRALFHPLAIALHRATTIDRREINSGYSPTLRASLFMRPCKTSSSNFLVRSSSSWSRLSPSSRIRIKKSWTSSEPSVLSTADMVRYRRAMGKWDQ